MLGALWQAFATFLRTSCGDVYDNGIPIASSGSQHGRTAPPTCPGRPSIGVVLVEKNPSCGACSSPSAAMDRDAESKTPTVEVVGSIAHTSCLRSTSCENTLIGRLI
jgi:hypothetical protein